MSIEMRIDNACTRCDGRGVTRVHRGPLVVCSCPTGRMMAISTMPLMVVEAVSALRSERTSRARR